MTGRCVSPRKIPVSGRSRQPAEIAMAVDAQRRHQRGEAVEQLERGQALRAVPARTLLGALVEQMVGTEFAQPVQGER